MTMIAVLDDWLGVAPRSADWNPLTKRATVDFFDAPLGSEDEAARILEPYDVIVPMRERQLFPASLIDRLPTLKLLALTGYGTWHIAMDRCTEHGIICCGSGTYTPAATAELAFALILSAQRDLSGAERNMREGRFQHGLVAGKRLDGATMGVVGLGRIGAHVGKLARAFGMKLIAWSPNLTPERAAEHGATAVTREALFEQSDIVSVHLAYGPATHHIIGIGDLGRMRDGALLVNTARSHLIDPDALRASLENGRIRAALDVYETEPLPADDPLRALPNVTLSPHLGFSVEQSFEGFYRESVENVSAFLDGSPIRVIGERAK